jgi:hypothetical protein
VATDELPDPASLFEDDIAGFDRVARRAHGLANRVRHGREIAA